jgi:hypothetical protein
MLFKALHLVQRSDNVIVTQEEATANGTFLSSNYTTTITACQSPRETENNYMEVQPLHPGPRRDSNRMPSVYEARGSFTIQRHKLLRLNYF